MALNDIPRKRFRYPMYGLRDTYELALKVERYLAQNPTHPKPMEIPNI